MLDCGRNNLRIEDSRGAELHSMRKTKKLRCALNRKRLLYLKTAAGTERRVLEKRIVFEEMTSFREKASFRAKEGFSKRRLL